MSTLTTSKKKAINDPSELTGSSTQENDIIERKRKLRFAATIEQLGVIYSKEITDLLLHSYYLALGDVAIEQLENAAHSHVATSKFFPKPCELRKQNSDAVAMRAWDTASDAASMFGAYKSVDFQDYYINAVIRFLGGWIRFCSIKESEENWRRKEFLEVYKEFVRHGVSAGQSQALCGLNGTQGVGNKTIGIASNPLDQKIYAQRPRIEKSKTHVHEAIGHETSPFRNSKDY